MPANDRQDDGPDALARTGDQEPDVVLDVPVVKVEEITLEVENLQARVSLQADVLDLLRLGVGADVVLGHVDLTLKGVEAQALLKVRLGNVARIIERVMQTIDANPQILENVTRGTGTFLENVGTGTGQAVGAFGQGTGQAVQNVGTGAGQAVRDVGPGAGQAIRDAGPSAGQAVRDVGPGAGQAVRDAGPSAGQGIRDVGTGAGQGIRDVGTATGQDVRDVGAGGGGEGVRGVPAGTVPGGRGAGSGAGTARTAAARESRAAGTGGPTPNGTRTPSPGDARSRGNAGPAPRNGTRGAGDEIGGGVAGRTRRAPNGSYGPYGPDRPNGSDDRGDHDRGGDLGDESVSRLVGAIGRKSVRAGLSGVEQVVGGVLRRLRD